MKDILDNKIAEFRVGSILYGTNTPESDEDYAGIFIEPIEYLFSPFRNIEEINDSIKSKKEDGKNDKDAIDRKFYSMQKFIKLAYDNNPNITEMLFINKDNILLDSEIYQELRSKSHLFINQNMFKKFYGYAISQEHKMYIKSDKYNNILKLYNIVKTFSDKMKLEDIKDHLSEFKIYIKLLNDGRHSDEYLSIGESYELPTNLHLKDVINKLEYILEKASYRSEYIFKKGYDYKFGSHVVRLLDEAIEFATEGILTFPLKNVEQIKQIKTGNVDMNELSLIIEEKKNILNELELKTTLPPYGKYLKDIEKMVMSFYK